VRWLLACQKSGYLRTLLRARGHDAWTCDLEPAEDGSEFHLQMDAKRAALQYWDALFACPECRFLCSSGQHRTDKPGQRTQGDVEAAVDFFMFFVDLPIPLKAIENSIGIMSTRYRKPDQIIHPYQFGDDASKATCLWLFDLPPLMPTKPFPPRLVMHNGKMRARWGNQTDS